MGCLINKNPVYFVVTVEVQSTITNELFSDRYVSCVHATERKQNQINGRTGTTQRWKWIDQRRDVCSEKWRDKYQMK